MKRVALVLALAASPVAAQPAPEAPPSEPANATAEAKSLYAEGKRYYDVADYDHAIEIWKKSYVLASAPILLFNIGQAYRLKGDCANALRFYSNYEREAPDADHTEVDQAKARCNPQPTGANPPPTFPPAKPDAPTTVAPAPQPAPQPEPQPDKHPMPPDAPAPETGGTLRTTGLVTAIGGAAAVAVGLYLGSRARDDANQVTAYKGEWTTTQQDLEQSGQSASTWSAITLAVGGAAIVAGVAMYVVGASSHHVDVAVTPHGAGLTWAASF